jgi:glycosyltransferase involved in cell wall biosynthesis
MKVAHVITRLLKAGSEENTISSCLYQLERGFDVYIIHGNEFEQSHYDTLPPGLKLIRLDEMVHPISPKNDAAAVASLRKLYKDHGFDVVHTHQSKAGILGRLAAVGLPDVAVVHTVHIAPFLNVGGATKLFYLVAERACAMVTDMMISVSEGMRKACLDHGVSDPNRHAVIRSGMPLERFTSAKTAADWRGRIGGWAGKARPNMILTLAAFEPRKRQEAFIEAMAPHLRGRDDVCLLFAGQGVRLEPARALAESLGIGDKVRFLGHDPKPEELIALADICVLTSEREGLPRVVVQYFACGKPAVVSDLPGIEEIVKAGVNGLVTDADDLNDTALAIVRLCDTPAELDALSRGARETDVTPWAQDRMGRDIETAYRAALARKRRTPMGEVAV